MSRAGLPPGRLLLGVTLGLLLVGQLAACSGADQANALGGQPRLTPTTKPSAGGRNAARAGASGMATVAPTPLPAEVAAVIALTNQDRLANGCPALAPNPILMGTAQAHSADMALHHFFAHISSTGLTPPQRLLAAGYQWATVAENIAAGYPTAQSVVDSWFNETPPNDPHRANMLNCRLHDVGVGYYYLAVDANSIAYHEYWTEDFGTLANS
jgi:uncharacterized protein YkwD